MYTTEQAIIFLQARVPLAGNSIKSFGQHPPGFHFISQGGGREAILANTNGVFGNMSTNRYKCPDSCIVHMNNNSLRVDPICWDACFVHSGTIALFINTSPQDNSLTWFQNIMQVIIHFFILFY